MRYKGYTSTRMTKKYTHKHLQPYTPYLASGWLQNIIKQQASLGDLLHFQAEQGEQNKGGKEDSKSKKKRK
jgi:hypothetical protein